MDQVWDLEWVLGMDLEMGVLVLEWVLGLGLELGLGLGLG